MGKITVVHNFGGRRCPAEGPASVQAWGLWDCDPTQVGRKRRGRHSYGTGFPWVFDMEEKAYILTGSATLTPDDPAMGAAVTITAKDMVTFPRGWKGRWEVHSFLEKRYAFFDGKGIQVDEEEDDESEEEEEEEEVPLVDKKHRPESIPDTSEAKAPVVNKRVVPDPAVSPAKKLKREE
eukprot:m.68658 g.68658  ORF g.68658 m.68658 type:complete len:179 (-) comp18332_c0_seq1:119-655(-)